MKILQWFYFKLKSMCQRAIFQATSYVYLRKTYLFMSKKKSLRYNFEIEYENLVRFYNML